MISQQKVYWKQIASWHKYLNNEHFSTTEEKQSKGVSLSTKKLPQVKQLPSHLKDAGQFEAKPV